MVKKSFLGLLVVLFSAGAFANCGWCPGDAESKGTGHSAGMGMMKGMTGTTVTAEAQQKAIDDQIKYVKETAQLRTDLYVKQLELRRLWLDDEPDAKKLTAKLTETLALRKRLAEKSTGDWFGGHCGMMGGCGVMGGGMQRGMCRGMGMGSWGGGRSW